MSQAPKQATSEHQEKAQLLRELAERSKAIDLEAQKNQAVISMLARAIINSSAEKEFDRQLLLEPGPGSNCSQWLAKAGVAIANHQYEEAAQDIAAFSACVRHRSGAGPETPEL